MIFLRYSCMKPIDPDTEGELFSHTAICRRHTELARLCVMHPWTLIKTETNRVRKHCRHHRSGKYINDTSAALRDYLHTSDATPPLFQNAHPSHPPSLMVKSLDMDRRRDTNAPVGKRQLKEEYMFNTEDRQGSFSLMEGGGLYLYRWCWL